MPVHIRISVSYNQFRTILFETVLLYQIWCLSVMTLSSFVVSMDDHVVDDMVSCLVLN